MNTHLEFDRTLRIAIVRHIVERGHAPDARTLAAQYDCTAEQVEASLVRLHEHHGLVLHPHSHRVWLAHPFSTAPTHFYMERSAVVAAPPVAGGSASADVDRGGAAHGWWANCAKCALGAAAIAGGEVTIYTRLGAEREPLALRVTADGPDPLQSRDLVMHVALPVAHWWDNVCYTCSTILFFRDEARVNAWSAAHGINRGAILTMRQAWDLARLWYGNALSPDWRRKTAHEAEELFERLGLTGDFWRVPEQWR